MHAQYRSINLIPKDDQRYQEHCSKMRFINNSNRFSGDFDYKQVITAWLEQKIIQHVSRKFIYDKRCILTWEEITSMNRYSRKFKEIDCLFSSDDGPLYMEVKASLSKSSFKRGKTQINENFKLLSLVNNKTKSILVMADCRCFDSSFGYAKEFIDSDTDTSARYKLIHGLGIPEAWSGSDKWLWLLDQKDVLELAKVYGPPEEEQDGFQDY